MTKAKFDSKQPDVRFVQKSNTYYVFICQNERVETETTEFGENSFYVYDYNEIISPDIDIEDVKENPGKYLDYKPQKEKTLEQKVQEQEETIRMLTSCLLEMSETVYA